MTRQEFKQIVAEEIPNAVPERFRAQIKNVAFLVEDEPSENVRRKEHLPDEATLLGYYHGIPLTERGDTYGIGEVLPDTIVLYQNPIEEEARLRACACLHATHRQADMQMADRKTGCQTGIHGQADGDSERIRTVIRETIWHEVAHYFGFEEHAVRAREKNRGKNGCTECRPRR